MRSIILAVVLLSVCLAKADDGRGRLRIELARVLVGEADGSRADWAAILWTLEHRRDRSDVPGMSLLAVAQYSVILRVNTLRAVHIRSLGTARTDWGGAPALRQRQWAAALAFVDEWMSGSVLDPCPESMHWDERGVSRPKLVPIDCGDTKNQFYALAGSERWQMNGSAATSPGGTIR